MSEFNKKYGPWAIVAGAAEGLGEAFSSGLAQRKMNIVMVDNQSDKLVQLAEKLKSNYGIQTKCLHVDLKQEESVKQIAKAISGLDTGLLIYNAAHSLIKPFISYSSEELNTFIRVNIFTQLQLVRIFSQQFLQQKRGGGILLMSSLAGLIGMQLAAPYAATKAFTWNLADSLHYELKTYNLDVMACIAGATATPAYLKTNPKYGWLKPLVMKPETVAETALNKLGKKTLFIPGFSNRMNYFILTRLLPRKMAASIANKTIKGMYDLQD